MCASFSSQPAELNSNDCITGHFTSLRMVFRSLLYIPYRLCICQVVPFFSISCQNCFQVVFATQVMLSQFWPVYNVNVCFSCVPSPMFSDFWEKIKSEWLFKVIPVNLPPGKCTSGIFSATIMQSNGFTLINLQVHELLVTICSIHEIYLHSQEKLMSSVQPIMRHQIPPF